MNFKTRKPALIITGGSRIQKRIAMGCPHWLAGPTTERLDEYWPLRGRARLALRCCNAPAPGRSHNMTCMGANWSGAM